VGLFYNAPEPTRGGIHRVGHEMVLVDRIARCETNKMRPIHMVVTSLDPGSTTEVLRTLDLVRKLNLCSIPTTTWQHPTRATSHQLHPPYIRKLTGLDTDKLLELAHLARTTASLLKR